MSTRPDRDIKISKALSYLLRHGAVKERLNIDSAGYVKVSEILSNNRLKTHHTTLEDLNRIVENNDKKRFNLQRRDDGAYICATQGHSLKTVSDETLTLLKPDEYPEMLIHGTTPKNLELILKSKGLSRMSRNHIHFTSILKNQGEAVSGLRNFTNVLIYLDVDKLKDHPEVKIYKSLNNVYLCPGDAEGFLSKDYFKKIIDRKTDTIIPFE
ncbi:CYFA0S01e00320g1_1 [Cyberlindnera fabianii]|uniref:2'-phosphotransferase n=1 Tax=Cyberlindnera fabianii TaxID=36022 RepID=A0A061ALS8_CYBFA|nr:CYFA0S01e00320g1_1 [Cyberlindnera fabianii]